MNITEYRHTDGLRRWELLYEGVYLVLLNDKAQIENSRKLFAFDGMSSLIWTLEPLFEENDFIVNVWIKNGELWAGSWGCTDFKLDHKTGTVLTKKETR
ncbi:MAG: hypothetical protein GY820_29800 [Gammaproteobacteria bacterium]|nr:hypothetical protein [Gammaproteobacteria bacterium]